MHGNLTLPMTLPLALPFGDPRAALVGQGMPLDPIITTFRGTVTITDEAAANLNSMLHILRVASGGPDPAFFWVGGSSYNRTAQDVAIIGGTASLVSIASPVPVADGANSCRFNRGSYFQFTNPAAIRETDADEFALALWYETLSTEAVNSEIINAWHDTGRGPRLQQADAAPKLFIYQSASDATAVTATNVNQPTETAIVGPRICLYHLKKEGGVLKQRFWRDFDDYDYGTGNTISSMWNDYGSLFMGSYGGVGSTVSATAGRLANVRIYAAALLPVLKDVQLSTRALVAGAPWAAGLRSPETAHPAMLCFGDSTMNNRWNPYLSLRTNAPAGGAWNGNLYIDDRSQGGSSLLYWTQMKSSLIAHLSVQAFAVKYFVVGVEVPNQGTTQDWNAIGVTIGDTAGWYAWIEDFISDIEASTGCTPILCSYIKGNSSGFVGQASDRDTVSAMCSANGWAFVDLYACPHSQIYTGAVPGTYGFYEDDIHPSPAGSRILAERFAASIAHPVKTSAPKFDITAPPVVSGTEQVGQTLSCTTGTVSNTPDSYTYQWFSNLTAISGATSSTYTLQAAESGKRVCCRVTAVKSGQNSTSFTSAPTGAIAA